VQKVKQTDGFRTAQYVAMNDKKKDLVIAMADMAILQDSSLDMSDRWQSLISLRKPKWIVVDGNWSPTLLSQIISIANKEKIKVAFEPVSVQKSVRIFQPDQQIVKPDSVVSQHQISLATPNIFELEMMYQTAQKMGFFESREWWDVVNSFEMSSAGSRDRLVSITNVKLVDRGIPQQTIQLLPYIPNLVVKLGEQGCLLAYLLRRGDPSLSSPDAAPYILGRATSDQGVIGGVYMRLFPPAEVVPQEVIVNVNGVGDTMLGVLMAGLAKSEASWTMGKMPKRTSATTVGASDEELSSRPARLEELIPVAQQAAVFTLKSAAAVSPEVQTLRDSVGHFMR
jgi:pseudouridylate synthase / pseudouridine kinase